MTYTGNPSLSPDVQQRVLDTFFQTLDLVAEGSRQEALLGCDFVLRMDPQFAAARTLQERLRASAGAVVDTDDLRALATGAPAPAAAALPADLFADLDGLGLELPELPAGAADLHAELNGLLERRQFQELLALAEREHGAVMSDPRLLGLVQEGQSRMEAEPYVQKFLTSARTALQAGNYDEVGRLLAKARTLDASHPGIAEIAGAVETVQAALAPPPAPPADRTAGFDLGFASPDLDFGDSAGSADTESDQRIRMLLDEGQRAFDGGDAQGAIDAWSRIFLIDIDHAEASRRIEQARKVKAESERQVEEVFHDGVAHLEAGDVEAARQAFQRVLELQPGYTTAAEYLQQIEAGHVPVVSSARPPARDPLTTATESLLPLGGLEPADDLKEEILVPPDPNEAPARTAERRPAKVARAKERRPGRLFLAVGSAVLVVVLGGGWFVWQNRERLFPNSQSEEPSPALPNQDPISRATAAHKAGKTASAISQLKRLPPSDPHYKEAQGLIAQWSAGTPSPAPAPTPAAAATPAAPAIPPERQALLDTARQAHAEGNFIRTAELLGQAETTGRLEASDAQLLADARQQIEPIAKQVDLFRQHEWEYILPELWRLREANPKSRDINRLIVDSYYNLGVRELQRTDPAKAADSFKEALALSPNDPALRRHYLFAQTYQGRPQDLLYQIYVKYLAYR